MTKVIHDEVMFGVDAGCIGVIDEEFLESVGGSSKEGSAPWMIAARHEVKPGLYHVTLKADNTWRGKYGEVEDTFIIKTSGVLIFSDLCYLFPHTKEDPWIDFLNNYMWKDYHGESYGVLDTGGDGSFLVDIEIRKVEEL